MHRKVDNLEDRLAIVNADWRPEIFAQMYEHRLELVWSPGDTSTYSHSAIDEGSIPAAGELPVGLQSGALVRKRAVPVVPRGAEHTPSPA